MRRSGIKDPKDMIKTINDENLVRRENENSLTHNNQDEF